MSSASESHHLLPSSSSSSSQIKPKLSPLDLGNTDLVSRLLAATPPYLYNMSLLPNTYFFSEMLRNLVQARNEKQNNSSQFYGQQNMRRSRKRAWNNRESFSSSSALNNSLSSAEIIHLDKPQEKIIPDLSTSSWMMLKNMKKFDNNHHHQTMELTQQNNNNKPEESSSTNNNILFNPPCSSSTTSSSSLQETTNNNLTLPPPPPIWYPPIYPNHPPYGIDPLHFFIDLRVSGHHIQNNNNNNNNKDEPKSTIVKNSVQQEDGDEEEEEEKVLENNLHHHQQGMVVLKSKRNSSSAFSVPQSNKTKKFDIKSMMGSGFDHDKTINNNNNKNKMSLNYIMGNLTQIYKNIHNNYEKEEEEAQKCVNDEITPIIINVESMNNDEELVEKQQKNKAKNDLRALIGLELVVDYMSHKKKRVAKIEEPSSSDAASSEEGEFCGSPPLEVVALNEET